MPRIDYVDEETISDEARALIESADETGAPDPRCVRRVLKIKMLASSGLNIGTVCFMGRTSSCPLKEYVESIFRLI